MDREFCIDYISDDCADCPERVEYGDCQTESHCLEVKQKIIADLRKLDKIEQIIDSRDGFYLYDNLPPFQQIKKVLEQE